VPAVAGRQPDKMTKKKKITLLLAAAVITLTLSVLAGMIATRYLNLDTHREDLLRAVKTALDREVLYREGSLSFRLRPTFTFTGVVIREKDGATDFITADRLTFKLAVLPLLKKNLVLRRLELENPRIHLIRDRSGAFNVGDLFEEKKGRIPLKAGRIIVRNGLVSFTDRWIAPGGLTTSLENLDLRLDHPERGRRAAFKISATVADEAKTGKIALAGSLDLSESTEPILNSRIDTSIHAERLNVGWYWPYYSRYVPFKKITGLLDMDTRYKGNFREFTSGGSMTMRDLNFDYAPIFHAPLKPGVVEARYEMKFDRRDISVEKLDVDIDGVNVKGSCLLKDLHTDDILIDASAVTTPIPWESYSHYVPYGVIPKGVADFIEQKIRGGRYRLDEGRLYGRVSQIAHMEKGDNANVLFIRGRAEEGLLKYGPDVPDFSGISGTLELKGKDFILHDMKGRFGDAPFSLEGKLADYCLETPTSYPFTMTMNPTAKEVGWLFQDELEEDFFYNGQSTLHLSGNGYTDNYNLNALWELSSAAYGYSDMIHKPAGRASRLSFKGNLNVREATLSEFHYDLASLALDGSVKYRHAGARRVALDFRTNTIRMEDVAPMLPRVRGFKPQGEIQASVRAEGAPGHPADWRWSGDVLLAGASFEPPDPARPVTNVFGSIRLKGDRIETSRLHVQLGNSPISLKGIMTDLKNPVYALTFSSPELDVEDIGLRHPKQPVRLKSVSGSATLKGSDLHISSMAFHLNESILNIRGLIADLDSPRIDMALASPYLDTADMLILAQLEPTRKKEPSSSKIRLRADLSVDAGKMDKIPFQKLKTVLALDENILYLDGYEFLALGGGISGKSRIDLSEGGAPRYQSSFKLDKLSLEQCFRLFDIKKGLITGALTAQGDLTAKGQNAEELKKTLLGNVRVQMEEGTLKNFAALSKVFSILNVSQLLKFQLPDMARGGMPYNRLTTTLSFRDGIMSSSDLLVKSDAMNIVLVGNLNLLAMEVFETTLGVQPLQTVDKVVSLIPVVGWILTDKNRGVITVYFELKGPVGDVEATAIPVKSISMGIFDIFKNIFQLPAKLITDTGEVILGR
jgi:uncharacterized protein YhdP